MSTDLRSMRVIGVLTQPSRAKKSYPIPCMIPVCNVPAMFCLLDNAGSLSLTTLFDVVNEYAAVVESSRLGYATSDKASTGSC